MFNKNLIRLILIAAGVFFFRSYNQSNDNSPDLAQKPSIITRKEDISEENILKKNIPDRIVKKSSADCPGTDKNFSIEFFKTNKFR